MAGGANSNDEDDLIGNINVTPLVDIMMVLLIIFMVTATYIVAKSIPVDLPEAATGEDVVTTFAVTLTRDGQTYLDGKAMTLDEVRKRIRTARSTNKDVRAVIAADTEVIHGRVVAVIDAIREEGISKFALNIQAPKERAGE